MEGGKEIYKEEGREGDKEGERERGSTHRVGGRERDGEIREGRREGDEDREREREIRRNGVHVIYLAAQQ